MSPEIPLALARLHRDAEREAARSGVAPGAHTIDALIRVTGTLLVRADPAPAQATSKARAWDLLLESHPGLAGEMRAALEATAETVAKRGAVSWDGAATIEAAGRMLRAV